MSNYLNQKGEMVGEPCLLCHSPIWYIEEDTYEMFEGKLVHKKCKEKELGVRGNVRSKTN